MMRTSMEMHLLNISSGQSTVRRWPSTEEMKRKDCSLHRHSNRWRRNAITIREYTSRRWWIVDDRIGAMPSSWPFVLNQRTGLAFSRRFGLNIQFQLELLQSAVSYHRTLTNTRLNSWRCGRQPNISLLAKTSKSEQRDNNECRGKIRCSSSKGPHFWSWSRLSFMFLCCCCCCLLASG